MHVQRYHAVAFCQQDAGGGESDAAASAGDDGRGKGCGHRGSVAGLGGGWIRRCEAGECRV